MVGSMGKGVIIVLVIAVVAVGAFVISGSDIPLRSGTGGTAPVADIVDVAPALVGGQNYNGQLTVNFKSRDSNDPAITYDGTTDFDVICFERIGDNVRDWEVLGSGDDATVDETTSVGVRRTTSTDAGVTEMWCEITPETGGASVYFDVSGTLKDSRVDSCIYEDPSLDQTNDYVCRINLLSISVTDPNTIPSLDVRIKFMENAVSANLNQASSILDIGTGSQENRIKWFMDFVTTATQNDAGAKALSQIQISVNATDGDDTLYDIGKSMIEIPNGANVQRIKFTQMDTIPLSSKTQYKWDYDQATGQRDVASANHIVVEKGQDNEVDTPVIFQTRFGDIADALCVELLLNYVDSFNVFSATIDSAELVADSANVDECVI
jgi:hypothetical protein